MVRNWGTMSTSASNDQVSAADSRRVFLIWTTSVRTGSRTRPRQWRSRPPAACFSIHSPHSKFHLGHGIVDEFGIFDSRSATAGGSNAPTNGCGSAIRGAPDRKSRLKSNLAVTRRCTTDENHAPEVRCGSPNALACGTPRHARRRIQGQQRQFCSGSGRRRRPESFDFQAFNSGDHYGAVMQEDGVREHHQVLIPTTNPPGQAARCSKQCTFASCALQDHAPPAPPEEPLTSSTSPARFAVQLNPTPIRHRRGGTDAVAGGRTQVPGTPPGLTSRTLATPNRHPLPEASERAGPFPCSAATLPGTSKSFRDQTAWFSEEVRLQFPAMTTASAACRLHRRGAGDRYVRMANPRLRAGVIRSTALRSRT